MSRRFVFLIPILLAAPVPVAAEPAVEITQSRVEIDRASALSSDQLFEVGDATFKKDAAALLDAVAKAIVKENKSNIDIDVHTDDSAPDSDRSGAFNGKLSQARADAIKSYFIRKGVAARRLTARGRGQDTPIASNGNEDGRRQNRRVEFVVEIEIRPPVADLAVYTKTLKGSGSAIIATMETSQGTLHCTLFADRTPVAVANFIGLATGQKPWVDPKTQKVVRGKPFYDGLVFHRVIPNFMIQGGDPLGVGTGGPGYQFSDETFRDIRNVPGTIAMANAGPGTNGSQFFINEVRSDHLNGKHTVFGQCKELELITKIANVPRDSSDKPSTPVVIRRITFARGAEAPPQGPLPPPNDPYRRP
jgi:peptidyl-prolyl cis-trans isomerase A (cyclophilin A)